MRRYERPREEAVESQSITLADVIPYARAEEAIGASCLSAGSRALLRGLLRLGTTRVFPGGGVGIEPFAGLNVTSVHLDPPAVGIEGVGVVAFARDG